MAADPKVQAPARRRRAGARAVARCHALAASQIAAGSDIVFPVARRMRRRGAAGGRTSAASGRIGVDADQSYLGPSMLASAALRVDQAVILAIDAVHDGTFAGGRDVEFGIAQNAVGIDGVNAAVPPSIRSRLNAVAKRLRAGRISIPTALGTRQREGALDLLAVRASVPENVPLLSPCLSVIVVARAPCRPCRRTSSEHLREVHARASPGVTVTPK